MTVFSSPPPSFNDEVHAEFSSVCFISGKGCGHSSTFLRTCSLKICKKNCTRENFHYIVLSYVCSTLHLLMLR